MTNSNDTAYPESHHSCWDPGKGLTKRELFAAMAMQGFCAAINPSQQAWTFAEIVDWSVRLADDLIAELNKEKK